MLGDIISRILKEKNVSKSELSRRTNINIGHITHIEKEERNPSHRALKAICRALDVPYQPMMNMYDKGFTDEQRENEMPYHISYSKIPAVNSIDSFIECPIETPNANMAVKVPDKSMEPRLEEGTYAFIEFNTPLENKDIAIFEFNGKIIFRRYVVRKGSLVLRPDNKEFDDIVISEKDNYNIIGRVVGTSTGLYF